MLETIDQLVDAAEGSWKNHIISWISPSLHPTVVVAAWHNQRCMWRTHKSVAKADRSYSFVCYFVYLFTQRKWKQKSIEEIWGIPKSKKRGGRKKKNCFMLGFAVGAAALPIFSEGLNKIYLNEAQTVGSLNKIMGQDYAGDQVEVIRGIMIMEVEDDERAKNHI